MIKKLKFRLALQRLKKYKASLSQNPLDAQVHYDFAIAAYNFGIYNLSRAELKNAEYLGFNKDSVSKLITKLNRQHADLTELDVNQYQRFKVLQSHLKENLNNNESILDIGGGHGILSQFMPSNSYFLIEPSVNGISGLKLPFADSSFDAVVTCHVLEHIQLKDRATFIDELIRVAKKKVLIFNPFKDDALDERKRIELVLEITKASWAKEHLDCGLPSVEEVEVLLRSRGLAYSIKGYGDIYASMATVFMSYFAGRKNSNDIIKINRHLNQSYNQLSCSEYPTNIMIEIDKGNDS